MYCEIVASKYDPQIYRLKWGIFFVPLFLEYFIFVPVIQQCECLNIQTNLLYPFVCMRAKPDLQTKGEMSVMRAI